MVCHSRDRTVSEKVPELEESLSLDPEHQGDLDEDEGATPGFAHAFLRTYVKSQKLELNFPYVVRSAHLSPGRLYELLWGEARSEPYDGGGRLLCTTGRKALAAQLCALDRGNGVAAISTLCQEDASLLVQAFLNSHWVEVVCEYEGQSGLYRLLIDPETRRPVPRPKPDLCIGRFQLFRVYFQIIGQIEKRLGLVKDDRGHRKVGKVCSEVTKTRMTKRRRMDWMVNPSRPETS